MIWSQDFLLELAVRIEKAYRRRYPRWNSIGLTPGVWVSAASRLIEVSNESGAAPIDPELYVATQPRSPLAPDPWTELTQHSSLKRYTKALRRIVTQLRLEIEEEVSRAEGRLVEGVALEEVIAREGTRISPLSRFILAHRAGRADLSKKHRIAAMSQHRSCPLYRLATRKLLPTHVYPAYDHAPDPTQMPREIIAFSRN